MSEVKVERMAPSRGKKARSSREMSWLARRGRDRRVVPMRTVRHPRVRCSRVVDEEAKRAWTTAAEVTSEYECAEVEGRAEVGGVDSAECC